MQRIICLAADSATRSRRQSGSRKHYSMRRTLFFVVACLSVAAAAADADLERRVKMKTSRQLKEGLAELGVKVPDGADKEKLRSIALKHWAKYEKKHPPKPRAQGGGPGGGPQNPGAASQQIFKMMDKDQDGVLTKEEFQSMGGGGGPAAAGQADDMFNNMDTDGSGSLNPAEVEVFFANMMGGMGGGPGMGGGGMGGGGMGGGGQPKPKPGKPKKVVEEEEEDVQIKTDTSKPIIEEDDDDILPSHDEL